MWFLGKPPITIETAARLCSGSYTLGGAGVDPGELVGVYSLDYDRARLVVSCEVISRLLRLPEGIHITSVEFVPISNILEIYTRSDNPTLITSEGAHCATIDYDVPRA